MRRDAGSRRPVYCGREMMPFGAATKLFFAACKALDVWPEAIRGKYRGARIVEKRDLIAYVLRSRNVALEDIGLLLRRDHSTVIHAVQKIANRLQGSGGDAWSRMIERIETRAA